MGNNLNFYFHSLLNTTFGFPVTFLTTFCWHVFEPTNQNIEAIKGRSCGCVKMLNLPFILVGMLPRFDWPTQIEASKKCSKNFFTKLSQLNKNFYKWEQYGA